MFKNNLSGPVSRQKGNFNPHDTSDKDWDDIYKSGGWRGKGSGPGSLVENNKFLVDWLRDLVTVNGCKSIIDIGCGDCQWIFNCFSIDCIEYTGVDFSKVILGKNKQSFNVTYVDKDIADSNFDMGGCYDILICKDLLHHNLYKLPEIEKNIRSIKAQIKIIVTPENTFDKISPYFKNYDKEFVYHADERKVVLKSVVSSQVQNRKG